MPQLIEVTVSPQGETKIQTKGYEGSRCQEASKFLEQALGLVTAEQKTSEFYASAPAEQQTRGIDSPMRPAKMLRGVQPTRASSGRPTFVRRERFHR